MDNGGGNPPAGDQSQKELTVALTASSMINASDMINAEAYQANVKRIQDVRDIVRTLEFNNEVAHRNFFVDQLEKRAKDGREAESMLAQLRGQQSLPATVQFSNSVSSGRSEDRLPTTATLVEVPDSHSSPSYSPLAPSTSHPLQAVQQSRPVTYQWGGPQIQSYPDVFRHYVPPATTLPSLRNNGAQHMQAPVYTRHWYPSQNPLPRPKVLPSAQTSQPIQSQQPVRSWVNHPPQAIVLPAAEAPSAIAPSAPGTSPSSLAQRGLGVSTQPVTSRPPFTTHNQSLNHTSRVPVPSQSVPIVPVRPLAQTSIPTSSNATLSQLQPISTTVSNQVATSEPRRSYNLPEQLQQQQHQPRPQQLSAPQLQPQQQPASQFLRPQPMQLQSHSQQSQQPLQPSQPRQKTAPPPVDRVPSINVSQPPTQPAGVPAQSWQRGAEILPIDQATFIQYFHEAVQRGVEELKKFWFNAKARGISDEWLRMAIDSLPRNVWNAVLMQIKQSGSTPDSVPPANASQQQVQVVPNSNMPVVSASQPPIAPPRQMRSTTQQATAFSISSEGDSASRPLNNSYAPQLQYYAEQAARSAQLPQMIVISASSQGSVDPAQITVTTPKRDTVPQVAADVRTPKDANKSTLARDVLHALGRTGSRDMGSEPTNEANDEGDERPEVETSQSTSYPAVAKSVEPLLEAVLVGVNPPTIPSANPNVQGVLQGGTAPSQSPVRPALRTVAREPAIDEGPTMIDLTLEDTDESIDGNERESNQTSTHAVISSQPVSPTNATDHTRLLESLSLEEPTVPRARDSDNADVRMRSPVLVTGTEKNTVSEPVYPSPGGVERASQSFDLLLDERNEDQLDSELPLFLPSPPASPAPTEPPVTDFEEDETRPPKRDSVDVDTMEIDREMETLPRARKRRRLRVYVLIPPVPRYVKRAKLKGRIVDRDSDSDSEGVGQDEELQYSHLEQLLIEESKSRLLERRCRWSDCGAILNSAANLLGHLRNHADEEATEDPFLCRWAGCERQFSIKQERDVHLERHAMKPLPCSFAGCDKQFDKPVEVMEHEVQHQKPELLVRKPTFQPIVPAIPARLGLPPHWLPSHRVIPRRIAKCQISAERHAIVGPWVLWNIFSPVELNMRKQNATMRSRPARQAANYDVDVMDPRHDDYDFLAAVSPAPTKETALEDLDSGEITMSAARGLTLWGVSVEASEGERVSSRDSVERMLTE